MRTPTVRMPTTTRRRPPSKNNIAPALLRDRAARGHGDCAASWLEGYKDLASWMLRKAKPKATTKDQLARVLEDRMKIAEEALTLAKQRARRR